MEGKFLTRNVVLFTECMNATCDHTGKLDIETLRDFGEGECPKCEDSMMISQECLIKN